MPSHGLVLALIVTGAGDDAMKTSEGCSPPPTPPTIPTWSPWRSSRTAMPPRRRSLRRVSRSLPRP